MFRRGSSKSKYELNAILTVESRVTNSESLESIYKDEPKELIHYLKSNDPKKYNSFIKIIIKKGIQELHKNNTIELENIFKIDKDILRHFEKNNSYLFKKYLEIKVCKK